MAFLTFFRGLRLSPLAVAALLVPALFLSPVSAARGQEHAAEYKIKAAYLYKFCDYVEWPEAAFDAPDSPLVIGVLGADDMAADLADIVRGRRVKGRSVEVKVLQPGEPVEGMQVLFIAGSDQQSLAGITAEARERSILTITELKDFDHAGSVINFVIIGDRVRFDVALDSAHLSNLRISSRLLAVARNVIRDAS